MIITKENYIAWRNQMSELQAKINSLSELAQEQRETFNNTLQELSNARKQRTTLEDDIDQFIQSFDTVEDFYDFLKNNEKTN